MGMKIALFQGAHNNAGDYLIVDRTKKLLKHFYPDCEISEFYRNQSLEPYKDEINKHDIGIFAGGPSYFAEFYPALAPLVSNLRDIKIPIMFVGSGWFGEAAYPDLIYGEKFKYPQKKLLTKAVSDTKILGCRDFYSVHVLRNNGYKNALMTGCPAWYDLDYLDKTEYDGVRLKDVKKICISDCGDINNLIHVGHVLVFVREFFGPDVEINYVTHKSMGKETSKIVLEALGQLNVKMVDISGGLEGFTIYDDCDLHIGFRVHAHIYNMSRRNASLLIEEDARGAGANDALGLPHISVKNISIKDEKHLFVVNQKLCKQLEDCLIDLESCNYDQMSLAYGRMNRYFDNMKMHILSIGEILNVKG